MREPVAPDPDEHESVLDDADRQSIREWFRRLVSLRSLVDRSETHTGADEETRSTQGSVGDLYLPRELAADVKGGSPGAQGEGEPDERQREPS
jgi:hypothetical protein